MPKNEAVRPLREQNLNRSTLRKVVKLPYIKSDEAMNCEFGLQCLISPPNSEHFRQYVQAVVLAVSESIRIKKATPLDHLSQMPHFKAIASVAKRCEPCWNMLNEITISKVKDPQ